jgi:hypothetical protein
VTQRKRPRLKGWLLAVWEYAGEIVLACLVSGLLFAIVGHDVLHNRLCSFRSDLMLSVGAGLGISATIWVSFFAVLPTEFGAWLRKKDEAVPYSWALATPILSYLLGLLSLLFTACSESVVLLQLNVFVLSYDLINFVTLIRNVNGLIGLWQTWEQQRKTQ